MKGITILAALMVLLQVRAQDERVRPYMAEVNKQFGLDEAFRIEMDYIREDIMRETRGEGEGIIWMKGLKYKIEVDEYIIYYDGEKQYSQNTDTEEVYVSAPDPGEPGYLQAVPLKVIKSYEQDFRYQYMGERPFNGKNHVEIKLSPKDITGPYSMLKLYVHPQSMKLAGFVLKHKEGINYTMILSRVEGGQDLDDSTFRFDPEAYPNTEIIELLE